MEGGHRPGRHILLGACLALAVNLGLFALAPLLLDQDVRTTLPLVESVDLRVPMRSRPAPELEPDAEPDMKETVLLEVTAVAPELTPEKPEAPTWMPPEVEMPLAAPPPKSPDVKPPQKKPSDPVKADPLPERPVKSAAVSVPAKQPSVAGEGTLNPMPVQESGPASAAPAVAGKDGKGYTADQIDAVPSVVGQPRPVYPYRARRRNIEGWVKIRFLVDHGGRVHDLTILAASPKGVFDDAVKDAVPRWRFRPGKKAGRAVDVWVETTIQFELD